MCSGLQQKEFEAKRGEILTDEEMYKQAKMYYKTKELFRVKRLWKKTKDAVKRQLKDNGRGCKAYQWRMLAHVGTGC